MDTVSKTIAKRDDATLLEATAGAAAQKIVCDGLDEKTAIIVQNTSQSEAATVTVVAGNGMRSSIGDLEINVPASSEYIVGPLDSMRFKDLSDGTITVKIKGGETKIKPFTL